MPKKFKGENSKAVEAKARKSAQKDEEEQKKQRHLEEEFWKEDDKHVLKKLQRKEEKEKKKTDQLERKKENQKILDEELAVIASKQAGKSPVPDKLTRAEADAHRIALNAADKATVAATVKANVQEQPDDIEENVNRIFLEGEHARSVDEAIGLLSIKDPEVDMHPEKRMKAAYLAFEEKYLPVLKQENPNLRLSQLKQLLKKDWSKSPENPLNQCMASANAK